MDSSGSEDNQLRSFVIAAMYHRVSIKVHSTSEGLLACEEGLSFNPTE
jgi:hypothetical protein